ncbi:Ammonium transporter 1 member 2 [Gracilariopsis chorda]|uniref:Ammonium transporter 1 member 2 n=1 Tax=Gracilariopsis chorda TaxID=448386 RepID=A0A2V3IYB4_9FLOR|nr:Ammonium transporter 1 member 2 [Gracilariopsis chorda]|eukprot:PXF47142.1 Ammonium transporter 1 member 2 [Gracilariopsis chorda]
MGYAFFLTAFVYPVVSHWVWHSTGFLSTLLNQGMIDFAGCSVVHMVGGFAGLAGAIVVGPRFGRFNSEGKPMPMPGHSATLCTLGTFLLWVGWYGFNPGSALGITGGLNATVQRCAVTTTISGAVGGITTLVLKKLLDHFFDLLSVLNGILAGLVAITASCAFVDVWASVIIGAIGACVYVASATLLLFFKIDDPLEAFPIHGATGFWGCLAAGLFNRKAAQQVAGFDRPSAGVIDGDAKLLLVNFIGCIIIICWVLALLVPFFLLLKFARLLRISQDEELIGNDISKHGGVAYPEDPVDAAAEAASKELDSMVMDPTAPHDVDKV